MNVCLPVLESAVDLGIFFQLLDHKMAFINAFHFICGTLFHLLDHKYHWLVLFCLHVCANLFVSQRFCLISLGDFIELIIEMYLSLKFERQFIVVCLFETLMITALI